MGRRRSPAQPAAPSPAAPEPHVIHPTGVYLPDWVRAAFRLKASSLRREIRAGRLAVCKRCGRHYFTGQQLLDWLQGGELRRGKAGDQGAS